MKSRNRVFYPFLLTLLVISGLAAMQLLPPLTFCGYELRPVALLSDVTTKTVEEEQRSEPESDVLDSISLQEDSISSAEDTIPPRTIQVIAPPGVIAIEDFSFDMPDSILGDSHGMAHFYEALARRNSIGRPVRIAYYGDSFIEGDIMTSDLRAKLQTAYGGCGVGFVDVALPFAGFRGSVRAISNEWTAHYITDSKDSYESSKLGINLRYAEPLGAASMQLKGVNAAAMHQDTCQHSSLFFRTEQPLTITARINRGEKEQFEVEASPHVQCVQVSGRIGEVLWSVNDSLSSHFFGATMDGDDGIILDNFSLRGNSGASLTRIPDATLHDFAQWREYDLIVFQFGLNVASTSVKDYTYYLQQMAKVVHKFATAYPEASLLIVGMSDRGERQNGEIVSMPCVKDLNRYQRLLAKQTGCCYWNLFEAMGGEGSMGRMVHDEKPAMANLDYTHINARGGRFVAGLLFEALQAGRPFYDERRTEQ